MYISERVGKLGSRETISHNENVFCLRSLQYIDILHVNFLLKSELSVVLSDNFEKYVLHYDCTQEKGRIFHILF